MMSAEILQRQNADGGWSYRTGSSWTEPTCYALLALAAANVTQSDAASRGVQWLAARQRSDGGWAPRAGVDQSTWVTSLALLLPRGLLAQSVVDGAAGWLLKQTGRESGLVYRMRMRLLGVRIETEGFDGWPWFPGTAAWVAPTALSILALQKLRRTDGGNIATPIAKRIDEGRKFLLVRRCRDGGWNHGSTRALGYDSDSYPETTGVALLALNDSKEPEVTRAELVAEKQAAACRSLEGASWLTLALLARGRTVRAASPGAHGGTVELALSTIAQAAELGRNVFLS